VWQLPELRREVAAFAEFKPRHYLILTSRSLNFAAAFREWSPFQKGSIEALADLFAFIIVSATVAVSTSHLLHGSFHAKRP
jgi:hypothetical protein